MVAMKRASSKAAFNKAAKKCKTIEAALKEADSLPPAVRKLLGGRLVHVFGTYKEERHPFQNDVSALVNRALQDSAGNLQSAIDEAGKKKAEEDAEGAAKQAAHDTASAAAQAAADAAASAKSALNDSSKALADAKTALHNAEAAVKANAADKDSTNQKKALLEALVNEFFTKVKSGDLAKGLKKSAEMAAKRLGAHGNDLEKEFLTCVVRTFSKPSASWSTFDNIIDKELTAELEKILAALASELQRFDDEKATKAADVESAKAAVTAAEEAEKGAEATSKAANAAAAEAKAAAKTTQSALKQQSQAIAKAQGSLGDAEDALKKFQTGAVAAYTEVEALEKPPEPVAEEPAAPAVEAAMAPAPPAVERAPSRTILPSPAVLLQSARNLLPSPRLRGSPAPQSEA